MSGATGWMYLIGLGYGWTGGKTVAAVLEVMQAVQNPSAYTIHYTVLYCVEICVDTAGNPDTSRQTHGHTQSLAQKQYPPGCL